MEEENLVPQDTSSGEQSHPIMELAEGRGETNLVLEAQRAKVFGALFAKPMVHRFGRYIILDVLGQGGMGVVLKGYDDELDRQVALKVLHENPTGRHGPRLKREAQALAKLTHPNVVQVYEVGEADGQLFVAMEMINGQTLKQWQGEGDSPRHWKECVEIYLQVGQGLAAAHAKGLVHRDFKPGNAILDEEGRARVLDFGLARRAGEEGRRESSSSFQHATRTPALDLSLTKTGAILGTPAYMPPEQMRGEEADARSDQFSFCVSLYEALYRERPFEGDTLAALMVSMNADEVQSPPKGSRVPTKLRAVLLRGLASDPKERWPSMESLIEQLRPLTTPRGKRWIGLGLVTGSAVLGVSWTANNYMRLKDLCTGASAEIGTIWNQDRKDEVSAAILGTGLPYASDTLDRIGPRLDTYANLWASKHTQACEATRLRQNQSPEAMDLRMACLRSHKIALSATVASLLDADAATTENAVNLVAELPDLARCDDADLLAQIRWQTPPPNPGMAEEVQQLWDRVAEIRVQEKTGKYIRALEQAKQVASRAEELGYMPLVAEAWYQRGFLRLKNAQYVDGEQDLLRAHNLAHEYRQDEIALMSALRLDVIVGYHQQRYAEGLIWSEVSSALARRSKNDKLIARSLHHSGTVLQSAGEYARAEEKLRQALKIIEQQPGANPLGKAAALSDLAVTLESQANYAEAGEYRDRALQLSKDTLGEMHPSVGVTLLGKAQHLSVHGRYAEAMLLFDQVLVIFRSALGPDHDLVATTLTSMGNSLSSQGEFDLARRHHEQALQIADTSPQHGNAVASDILNNLGSLLYYQGDGEGAAPHFERSISILERIHADNHPALADPHINLGNVRLYFQKDFDQAARHFEHALRALESRGDAHPKVALALMSLGNTNAMQGKFEEAKPLYERALNVRLNVLGEDHPDVAESASNLGQLSLDQKEYVNAEGYFAQALQIREKALGADHHLVAYPLVGLAKVKLIQHEPGEARRYAKRAVSVLTSKQVGGYLLPDAQFVLARALWPDPRERRYAHELATKARDSFEKNGSGMKEELAEVELWLRKHSVR